MSKNPVEWAEQSQAFLSEVQVEFKKVTWPTQRETVAGTVSVIFLVVLVGVILASFDGVFGLVMGWVG